ncbi:MAG: DUF6705 family protein [Bacteroidota bacterium]
MKNKVIKNILKLTFWFIICTSSVCKAQLVPSNGTPLFNKDPDLPTGTYYKDIAGDLDKFEGTWKWHRNDSIATIVLEKIEYVFFDDTQKYEDLIQGEYKFVVGGNVIQDYLSRLNDNSLVDLDHYISGNFIMHKNHYPTCDECSNSERRLFVYFIDPDYSYINAAMILRHIVDNGQEKLEALLYSFDGFVPPTVNAPMQMRIPFGEYVFVKQD